MVMLDRVTREDVKGMLGILDDRTLRKLIRAGRFPPQIKVGKQSFWFFDTVQKALKLMSEGRPWTDT